MTDLSIDRTSFPAEGGEFIINITKSDPWVWALVTIPSATWYSIDQDKTGEVSPYLYRVGVMVDENTSGSTRAMNISVTGDGQSELFTIQQPSGSALSADIIAATSGNISSNGGQVTVDVYANGGVDSRSTAEVTSGSGYCTLTSTTHGVSSGGYTCTRFVFTFSENTGTATKRHLHLHREEQRRGRGHRLPDKDAGGAGGHRRHDERSGCSSDQRGRQPEPCHHRYPDADGYDRRDGRHRMAYERGGADCELRPRAGTDLSGEYRHRSEKSRDNPFRYGQQR